MEEIFGKNILEVLTTGMYPDDTTIFREYIQNAADSIRKAVEDNLYTEEEEPSIDIELLTPIRSIRITDNGYGVKKEDVEKRLLSIAASEKDEDKDMGYRGIGRLCGLAHCSKLTFKTTYPGEDVETIMTWDAEAMRIVLDDKDNKMTPREVLNTIVKYSTRPVPSNLHYFIVELDSITSGHDSLLDRELVKRYISETAPIKFAPSFHHRTKIEKYAKEHGFNLPCYKVTLEGKEISKNYSITLYKKTGSACQEYDRIRDVSFKEFRASDGEILAWMWFGISAFEKQIPVDNQMRGIRLRRHNIEIGDDKTLAKFFKEDRGYSYYVGEVHLIHRDLRPNNRRDYIRDVTKAGLNGQKTIRVEFEETMRRFFGEELDSLYREANTYKNALKSESELKKAQEEYKEKEAIGFINDTEKKNLEKKIGDLEKKKADGDKSINRIQQSAINNGIVSKMVAAVTENVVTKTDQTEQKKKPVQPVVVNPPSPPMGVSEDKSVNYTNEKQTSPLITDQLTKLTEGERKVVGRIYGIIKDLMPEDKALYLIQRIQAELKNE